MLLTYDNVIAAIEVPYDKSLVYVELSSIVYLLPFLSCVSTIVAAFYNT